MTNGAAATVAGSISRFSGYFDYIGTCKRIMEKNMFAFCCSDLILGFYCLYSVVVFAFLKTLLSRRSTGAVRGNFLKKISALNYLLSPDFQGLQYEVSCRCLFFLFCFVGSTTHTRG